MDPYIGEIRQVGFTFAPPGWLSCDGSLLSISDYEALFVLIGTTYGGDGKTTFALPDLRGRSALHIGTSAGITYQLGQNGGAEGISLTSQQLPTHVHSVSAQDSGSVTGNTSPGGATFGNGNQNQFTTAVANTTTANLMQPVGGSQQHSNLMPYLATRFIIATEGIYPSSN